MKQATALSLGILGLNESFVQMNEIMGLKKAQIFAIYMTIILKFI
jgi:hypothetical protein